MIYPSDTAVADLQRSLALLHEHFNPKHHYPIVLFVDNCEKWVHLQFIFSVRIHIIRLILKIGKFNLLIKNILPPFY
jgi:hypothetical protein